VPEKPVLRPSYFHRVPPLKLEDAKSQTHLEKEEPWWWLGRLGNGVNSSLPDHQVKASSRYLHIHACLCSIAHGSNLSTPLSHVLRVAKMYGPAPPTGFNSNQIDPGEGDVDSW